MNHPLARLARTISWEFLSTQCGAVYSDGPGQPPLPTRLMAGIAILKYMHNLCVIAGSRTHTSNTSAARSSSSTD